MKPEYKAHLFICTNDRGPNGKRESCAHKGAQELREAVKAACKGRFPAGTVRINGSGCLDLCEQGITAVMYPEGKWFVNLKKEDAQTLVQAVAQAVEKK